jgi:hypothetical protein
MPETAMKTELPAKGGTVALPVEALRPEHDALARLVLVPSQQVDLDRAERCGGLGQPPVEVVDVARPERPVVVQDQVEPLHAPVLQLPHGVQHDADPVVRLGG